MNFSVRTSGFWVTRLTIIFYWVTSGFSSFSLQYLEFVYRRIIHYCYCCEYLLYQREIRMQTASLTHCWEQCLCEPLPYSILTKPCISQHFFGFNTVWYIWVFFSYNLYWICSLDSSLLVEFYWFPDLFMCSCNIPNNWGSSTVSQILLNHNLALMFIYDYIEFSPIYQLINYLLGLDHKA